MSGYFDYHSESLFLNESFIGGVKDDLNLDSALSLKNNMPIESLKSYIDKNAKNTGNNTNDSVTSNDKLIDKKKNSDEDVDISSSPLIELAEETDNTTSNKNNNMNTIFIIILIVIIILIFIFVLIYIIFTKRKDQTGSIMKDKLKQYSQTMDSKKETSKLSLENIEPSRSTIEFTSSSSDINSNLSQKHTL